ncbi:hypothetical protein [Geminicoccus flavidas]|uniref:hypothetical protein n=1 Tax=Geminicoccus flavidas TaxID=2506407 RepID=UPI001358EB72|nr:hypothetical protein [Geminicoccus flavidas]
MPRISTLAQIEASRRNGRRSHGPITSAGRARAALNARTYGLRSAETCPLPDEDAGRFRELQDSVHDQFRPASPLEAALCARMVAALWRCERAERLEASYWQSPPDGRRRRRDSPDRLELMAQDGKNRHPALDTILRYLSQAQQAYGRAFRQLQQLRQGQADPDDGALFVTSDLPASLQSALEHQAAEPESANPVTMPGLGQPEPANDPGPAPAARPAPEAGPPRQRPTRRPGENAAAIAEICTNEPELAREWLFHKAKAWAAEHARNRDQAENSDL